MALLRSLMPRMVGSKTPNVCAGDVTCRCQGTVPPRSGFEQHALMSAHTNQILPQHCLYFLPLLHGQGSLRPTFGPARIGLALVTASAASLTMSLPRVAAVVVPPELALADPPKAAVDVCSARLGMLRRKFSNAMRLEALRKILWQISVLML